MSLGILPPPSVVTLRTELGGASSDTEEAQEEAGEWPRELVLHASAQVDSEQDLEP